MAQAIKSIEDENKALQEKLARLSQQEKELKKEKMTKLKPFGYKDLQKSDMNFSNVQSQIDYDLIMQKKKRKEEDMKTQKERIELEGCTFKPEVNVKSVDYIKNGNYVPLHQRKLPEKKEVVPPKLREEEEYERIQEELQKNKTKRKLDPEFFDKQQEWDKQKNNKTNKERLNKALNEYNVKAVPKLGKKGTQESLGEGVDFLKRVEDNLEKSKMKKKQLEDKYNSYSFKPNINKNNQVQSIVLKDIDRNDGHVNDKSLE